MVVDRRTIHLGERQAAETVDRSIGIEHPRPYIVDELSQRDLVHRFIVPCDRVADVA